MRFTDGAKIKGRPAFREYAAAVSDKDTAAAKRLASAADLLDRVAAECDRARHVPIVTGDPGSARMLARMRLSSTYSG